MNNILPNTAQSVHLSASAGSGKTRALKERYLSLLDVLDRSGLGIDQTVAITFTDKAAAEIKERVMKGLPEPMLKKIIRGRQDLRISTIHSFCMNLLKRYPLEAGLPPDFGVLDDRDREYKIRSAVEDALEESDRDREIMAPLLDFTADGLIAVLEFLLSIRSRLKRMEIDAGGPGGLLSSVRSGMGSDQADRELNELVTGHEWRTRFRGMEELLKPLGELYEVGKGRMHLLLSQAKNADAAARISEALAPIYYTDAGTLRKNPFISKKDYEAKNRKEYEDAYARIQALLARFGEFHARAQACREAISLLTLYLRAEEKYRNAKLREGLLDFDDLEIYAYRLLKSAESPDILYWLDRKILHFLVDEFQDTSDIQWAILDRLTEEIFAGQGADKPMPPTLFVVGDAKQSIYRFREANYRLIERVRRKMVENIPPGARDIRTLDRNYRSVPEVIETVNRVFSKLWEDAYQPSETERKDHHGSARLIELPGSVEETRSGPAEAEVLAGEIRRMVESGTIVYEKKPNSRGSLPQRDSSRGGNDNTEEDGWITRPARYSDCAVLIQSRTKLKEYEAALQQAGIPFRVVGGIGFYEEDEIQAVMNVLFFLWNQDDRLSLAAALKSPLFGITDQSILDIFTGSGDVMSALREREPRAWSLLHGWGLMAGVAPIAGLIHRVIRDSGAYIRFGGRSPQAIFNLDKILDTAREFDRRGYTTLQDFVEWVRNIRASEQREAAADMNVPAFEGAVSIMTVHKAKGLEFPVVFLPGMNRQSRSVSVGPRVIIESDGGVKMAVAGRKSPTYREMWDREREELKREHQRLFYVAMTRARDHLVMIGTLNNGKSPVKQDAWLDYVHRSFPAQAAAGAEGASPVAFSHPEWTARPLASYENVAGLKKTPREPVRIDAAKVLDNIAPLPLSASPEWKRATDFISEEKELPFEQPPMQPSGGVSPLVRGSLLHRCLESYTTAGSYDTASSAREFPEIEALGKEARAGFLADAEAVLRSVIGNEELTWIFGRGSDTYSELPFLYKSGRSLISGMIDRVVIRNGKGRVIDYKAIRITDEADLAAWKAHYLPQIRIYCEAVKEIFRLASVEGFLLFLDSSRLESVIAL